MAFQFTLTPNPMQIAETEYAAAASIQFTGFSSCIGIIGKITGTRLVFGVHVPLINAAGQMFNATDVATVRAVLTTLGADLATVMVIGQLSVWEASNPAGYQAVIGAWPRAYPFAQGVYGATLDADGDLEITTLTVQTVIPMQGAIPAPPAASFIPEESSQQAMALQLEAAQEASSQAMAAAAQIAAQRAETQAETSLPYAGSAATSSAQAALAAQIQAEQAEEQVEKEGSVYQ